MPAQICTHKHLFIDFPGPESHFPQQILSRSHRSGPLQNIHDSGVSAA